MSLRPRVIKVVIYSYKNDSNICQRVLIHVKCAPLASSVAGRLSTAFKIKFSGTRLGTFNLAWPHTWRQCSSADRRFPSPTDGPRALWSDWIFHAFHEAGIVRKCPFLDGARLHVVSQLALAWIFALKPYTIVITVWPLALPDLDFGFFVFFGVSMRRHGVDSSEKWTSIWVRAVCTAGWSCCSRIVYWPRMLRTHDPSRCFAG